MAMLNLMWDDAGLSVARPTTPTAAAASPTTKILKEIAITALNIL